MANLGITLPIRRGNTGYFESGRDVLVQVKSNLTNLLLTRKGERMFLPTFGCDIHHLIFQPITDDIYAETKSAINQAIQSWMPYVIVEDIAINKIQDEYKIFVVLTFTVNVGVKITDSITLAF